MVISLWIVTVLTFYNKTQFLYLILKFYEVVLSLSSSHSIGTRVPKNCSPRYSRIIFNASKLIWNQQLILISRLLSHRSNVNPNLAAKIPFANSPRNTCLLKMQQLKLNSEPRALNHSWAFFIPDLSSGNQYVFYV